MMRSLFAAILLGSTILAGSAGAGQAPSAAAAADYPVSHQDRVYAAEQFSNTVSVIDPASNALLGVIRLGDPSPMNFSPLYKGQVLVHGMGFSPDHRTIAVEASATGLVPKHPYVLALSGRADGGGPLEPLASFMTNPAGAAIVNAVGPIRQVVQGGVDGPRRYLVIVPGTAASLGEPVQMQAR
jgi:YVTN family beta-propeller protein